MKLLRTMMLGALLHGCAGVGEADCRQADWYDLGFRDAIYGLQRQDGAYEHQCAQYGVKIDATRYVQGWNEGRYEADYRNPQPIQ